MRDFTPEQLSVLMEAADSLRNVAMFSYSAAEQSSLSQVLIAATGVSVQERPQDLDHSSDHQRDISTNLVKVPSALLYYEEKTEESAENRRYLINLYWKTIDINVFPAEFEGTKVVDGAFLVVDASEKICFQTTTQLRRAMSERIQPALVLDNIDKVLFDSYLSPEQVYASLLSAIGSLNSVIGTCGWNGSGKLEPGRGNCAFGNGKSGWMFSGKTFARMYARRLNVSEEKMEECLWGDNFFDIDTRKIIQTNVSAAGKTLLPTFCVLIVVPLRRLREACLYRKEEALNKMLEKINVELSSEERGQSGSSLFASIMKKWLPAGDCLAEMAVRCLPSPRAAAVHRAEVLYEGPMDDPCATAIRHSDPHGPLMLYISKMIPSGERGKLFGVGRVFSGTVTPGLEVRIMGPNYVFGKKSGLFCKPVQRVAVLVGTVGKGKAIPVPYASAGSIVVLDGIDRYLLRCGTITDCEAAYPLRPEKCLVSPVVGVTVAPTKPGDLPKLIIGLERLVKVDPLLVHVTQENGEHLLTGISDFHIDISLRNIEQEFATVELTKSSAFVIYKETVAQQSAQVCTVTSPNRHNVLHCSAQPMPEDVTNDIETGKFSCKMLPEVREELETGYGWDPVETNKIQDFGLGEIQSSLLFVSASVPNLAEIHDSLLSGFQWATREGPVCGEGVRGLRLTLLDAVLHSDAVHRGGGQIIPTVRRAACASILTAEPRITEPVYAIELQVSTEDYTDTCVGLRSRRGVVYSEEALPGTHLTRLKAYLPVAGSFDFQFHSLSRCQVSHWELIPDDPLDSESSACEIAREIRRRKGLSVDVPRAESYFDRTN